MPSSLLLPFQHERYPDCALRNGKRTTSKGTGRASLRITDARSSMTRKVYLAPVFSVRDCVRTGCEIHVH